MQTVDDRFNNNCEKSSRMIISRTTRTDIIYLFSILFVIFISSHFTDLKKIITFFLSR